jgi:hypothetical protein
MLAVGGRLLAALPSAAWTLGEVAECGGAREQARQWYERARHSYLSFSPGDVERLEGRSSLGRLGLLMHSTAGYVDPGWEGTLTLELSNVANLPIKLYDGMKIGQISFQQLSSPVEVGYGDPRIGSKYRGQTDPTASLYHRDFDRGRIRR